MRASSGVHGESGPALAPTPWVSRRRLAGRWCVRLRGQGVHQAVVAVAGLEPVYPRPHPVRLIAGPVLSCGDRQLGGRGRRRPYAGQFLGPVG